MKAFRNSFCFALVLAVAGTSSWAGLGGLQRNSVGGVMIDAGGSVRTASPEERRDLAALIRARVSEAKGGLAKTTETRVLSLKKIAAEIQTAASENRSVGSELEYLAGLQRIDYVLVDQANNDICIVGPAEPWTVLDDGSVVGQQSGLAPIRLIDLMTAFASVESARNGGISCSIEPTAEGRRNLQMMLKRISLKPGQNPKSMEPAMREAFGPQMILINGVAADSRIARTMVAADFEMKRIAMGLANSPVAALPSYLQMSRNANHSSASNPRWWMACDYDAVAHDDAKTAWKISGRRVATLTDEDLVQRDGSVQKGGTRDPLAEAWAEKMTENYGQVAQKIPVFADLENVMDLAVATTLIVQESLDSKAGLDLSPLMTPPRSLEPISYPVAESVDPQCSFIHGRRGWVVTASGGVDISGFSVVENQTVDANLTAKTDPMLASASDTWWWDAQK